MPFYIKYYYNQTLKGKCEYRNDKIDKFLIQYKRFVRK